MIALDLFRFAMFHVRQLADKRLKVDIDVVFDTLANLDQHEVDWDVG